MSGTTPAPPAVAPPVVTPPVVTPPVVTPPVVTPPVAPWYEGKVAPEHVGLWQTKGYDMADPASVAAGLSKAYTEANKLLGAPHDELVRFPKNPMDPAYDTIRQRLGVPAAPADYDFTAVKFTDGTALDPAAEQAFRQAAFVAGVPKDRVGAFAGAIVKHLESVDAADTVATQAALTAEKATLAANWGQNAVLNLEIAKQGAAALSFTPEDVGALESVVGYAKVMEALRRVGAAGLEDKTPFTGVNGGQGKIVTTEQAMARKKELLTDKDWGKRFLAGDERATAEMRAIDTIITASQGTLR